MKILSLLLFLTSCTIPFTAPDDFTLTQNVSPKKQKQKITALQKKLETAEKEQAKAIEEVEELRREMQLAQIQLIERQVEDFDREMVKYKDKPDYLAKRMPRDPSLLFLQEREILHRLIQGGPSPTSFDAQLVLDQILRLITKYSDERPYSF